MALKEYSIRFLADESLSLQRIEELLHEHIRLHAKAHVRLIQRKPLSRSIPIEMVQPAKIFERYGDMFRRRYSVRTLHDLLKLPAHHEIYSGFTAYDFKSLNYWLKEHSFDELPTPTHLLV